MPVQLGEIIQGLQMLGGVLSLPRQIQYQHEASQGLRSQLAGLDLTDDQMNAIAPEPGMSWLGAGPGVGGKILGGIGDVGSLISAIAGKPVTPPRTSISDIAAISKLRQQKKQGESEAALQEAMRLGKTPEEVASLGVAAGSTDQALRLYSHRGDQPPWRGDPGKRAELTMSAQRDERATRRDALIRAGHDPNKVDVWVETGAWPPSERQTPAEITADENARQAERDRVEKQRRLDFIKAHPGLTPEEASHIELTGNYPPSRQTGEKPIVFARLYDSVLREAQTTLRARIAAGDADPTEKVNEDAVMADSLQRARSFQNQGFTVQGMPQAKPEAPSAPPTPSEPVPEYLQRPPETAPPTNGKPPMGAGGGAPAAPPAPTGPQTPGAWSGTKVPTPDEMTPAQASYYAQLQAQVKAHSMSPQDAATAFGKFVATGQK